MDWFEKIQKYYTMKLYTNDQVKIFVVGDKITTEQYKLITGIRYYSTK